MKQWAARRSLFSPSFTARQKKVYINEQRITDNNENWTIHLKGKMFIVNKMLYAEYIDIYNCQYLLIESYALHYYYLAARSLFYILFSIAKFSEICIDFCAHHCYFAGCLLIQSGNHLFVIASKKETHQYFLQSQFLDIRVIFSPLDFEGLLPFFLKRQKKAYLRCNSYAVSENCAFFHHQIPMGLSSTDENILSLEKNKFKDKTVVVIRSNFKPSRRLLVFIQV